MITNLEVTSTEKSLADKDNYQQIRNYFAAQEPVFVEWITKIAKIQSSSMNLPLPANVNDMIESRMIACGLAGALVSMVHTSNEEGKSSGVEGYKIMLDNDPHEIWSAWVKGDLPDKFYSKEYIDNNNIPSWKEAVANHEAKIRESDEYKNRWELIQKADKEMPKDKKKVNVDL